MKSHTPHPTVAARNTRPPRTSATRASRSQASSLLPWRRGGDGAARGGEGGGGGGGGGSGVGRGPAGGAGQGGGPGRRGGDTRAHWPRLSPCARPPVPPPRRLLQGRA